MPKKFSRRSTDYGQLFEHRFDDALAPMKHLPKVMRVGASTLDAQIMQQVHERFAQDLRLRGI